MLSEDTGKELMNEMKYKELKHYNMQQIGRINTEIQFVDMKIDNVKRLAEVSEVTEELSINFAMLKAYKDRLLRISKAYHLDRFFKIEENYFAKENIKECLCLTEIEFERDFNKMTEEYFTEFRHLSLNDRVPPLNFYVQILTLEDCGSIMCGNEFMDLKKDRIYFLKKADIVHLIRRKLIKII